MVAGGPGLGDAKRDLNAVERVIEQRLRQPSYLRLFTLAVVFVCDYLAFNRHSSATRVYQVRSTGLLHAYIKDNLF